MNLEVKTDALRGYARSLQAWAGDTSRARTYAGQHLDLGWTDAVMFSNIVAVNDDVVDALEKALARLRAVCHASGVELAAAATMYDRTDRDAAERLDAEHEPLARPLPGRRYEDVRSEEPDTVPEKPEPEPIPWHTGYGRD